jgi:hypothetical protein
MEQILIGVLAGICGFLIGSMLALKRRVYNLEQDMIDLLREEVDKPQQPPQTTGMAPYRPGDGQSFHL